MLNYNHLRYFWAVAKEGHLTRAARELNVSQSALSAQIKKLEEQLGTPLFERRGRNLILSASGQIALDYCETIFANGDALVRRLTEGGAETLPTLRVGALSTMSRNFQISLLRPLLAAANVRIIVRSGTMAELLSALKAHRLDVVLANQVPLRDSATNWTTRLLSKQPVSLIGTAERLRGRTDHIELLTSEPVILPTADSDFRNGIDLLAEQIGYPFNIIAEIDDMAMMRLMAREDIGLAVLPPVVVLDELSNGRLVEACRLPHITEQFSAIMMDRRFPNPALETLLDMAKRGEA